MLDWLGIVIYVSRPDGTLKSVLKSIRSHRNKYKGDGTSTITRTLGDSGASGTITLLGSGTTTINSLQLVPRLTEVGSRLGSGSYGTVYKAWYGMDDHVSGIHLVNHWNCCCALDLFMYTSSPFSSFVRAYVSANVGRWSSSQCGTVIFKLKNYLCLKFTYL